MSLLDADMADALRAREGVLALLCEINHPDGTVRLWSGVGTLRWDGHDWTGAGRLGQVSTSPRSTELRIDEVRLVLAGVNPADAATLNMDIRNHVARTWIALVGVQRRVIGSPMVLDDILLDYVTEALGEDGSLTLTLVGQAGFWTLERTTDRAWSQENAILEWGRDLSGNPVETGFDMITALKTRDTKWTPPSA